MIVLGLISGTSIDRIDGAVVRFEEQGDTLSMSILACHDHPIPDRLRARLLAMLPPGRGSVRAVCEVNFEIGEAFAAAANSIGERAGIKPDLIASHGQTLYHLVKGRRALATLQVGAPAVIAERTRLTVAANFRPRDIAAGGQGAPLVSLLDVLLLSSTDTTRSLHNLGGISNMTVVAPGKEPLAFDTGPANALIDYTASRLSDGKLRYDKDGAWAARGKVNEALLVGLMAHPYFKLSPPKTTGKELFGPAFAEDVIARGLDGADIMATLTALTARSIVDAYRDFAPTVREIFLSGGGTHNLTLVVMLRQMLRDVLPNAKLRNVDELGVPSDAKEAIAFALLGYQTVHGRPGNVPTCTGAKHPAVLGSLTPGNNFRGLMQGVLSKPQNEIRRLKIV